MLFSELPRGLPGTDASSGSAPRALWLHPDHLKKDFWRYSTKKIFLGASPSGDIVGIADNRHLLTVAGSRAGKGTSAIIPNLLLYEGSVLVLDPKGENATITAGRRGKGHRVPAGGLGHDVHVLDPFRVAKVDEAYRSGFNPLADLDPEDMNFIDDCDSIADALVVPSPGKENDHWNSTARLILRGFIAWVAAAPGISTEKRTLNMVRHLLHLPPGKEDGHFIDLLDMIGTSEEVAHGVPSDAARSLLGMSEEELGSVLSTIRQNIGFLSSPPMAVMLEGNGRVPNLKTWKMGKQSIYLCLPAGRLHRHNRFFRLYLNRLLSAIESVPKEPDIPALLILDEMHVLGHMAALETAAGLLAGFGVRIWSIWQDFAQLKAIYRDRWETFLGNTSIFQSFGLNDMTTLKYVSERLGTSSTMQITRNEQSKDQAASGFSGQSKSIQPSPLASPDEVAFFFSRQSSNQLVIYPGADPIFMKRVPYMDKYFDKVREHDE